MENKFVEYVITCNKEGYLFTVPYFSSRSPDFEHLYRTLSHYAAHSRFKPKEVRYEGRFEKGQKPRITRMLRRHRI